ncbi:exopolysaccharide biosynthesis polyprenyl glycosylphosphotransferase [Nocardioides sp. MAH-18]|uniref:Exopolysaccharide biosynthesis polyprenyl glycosylphosphotransferase n=1 Tax=Nocardioides agri TaxID=2682843 RepID=A0A6L6XRM0_9ACTN|nr:sugar transferase [Nocardioides sp. CGMCC 1.13656]MBA2954534.1 sugar transferase [Nocardioides sp. CGMCC 1.13656]MVQ49393.1 exopolysaccharide biosynthesis polyprenyl glycosylphosphotransferase [Nocardioides sp. MAH-18]
MDIGAIAAAVMLAVSVRKRLDVFDGPADITTSLMMVGPLLVLGWLVAIALFGGYREDVFGVGTDEYKRVFNASLVTAGMLGIGCYLAKFQLSRGFFLLAFVVGIPLLLMGRLLLRSAIHRARRQGRLQYRVLIAGSPAHVDEVAAVLRREPWLGYHVAGALVPAAHLAEETASGIPIVGTTEHSTALVSTEDADVIFFAGGALSSASQLRTIVWELEKAEVQVVVAPSVTDVSGERIKVRPVGGLPLMHIDPPRATDAARWGKRLFDIVAAAFLIVAFTPLMAYAALRVRLHDGGPVFFNQVRTGRDGEHFGCLKFRTMVVDAEARLAELHAQIGFEAGLFKMKEDPRITPPGRWLRRFSLDELPQLFNVLRGDMSLVGPRPPLPREVAGYESDMMRRLRVRPGMTGLWQVSGRSDLSWSEAVRLDLYYVDNWSMLQDLSILGRTFGAVFGSRGAY